MLFDLEIIEGVSAIAIIIALVEIAKRLGMRPRYAPLLSLALGILASFGYNYYAETTWYTALITGLVLGLSAIGAYSGIKNTIEGIWQ